MKRYMLDTNIVSLALKNHPLVVSRLTTVPMASLCISVITQAELLFGLAKRPQSKSLHTLVHAFLTHIEVLHWRSDSAAGYGKLHATLEKQGRSLGALDMLIAAHAVSEQAVLVTNDRAFMQLPHMVVEDWSE